MRLTVKNINDELAKRAFGARLEKGNGYFYFSGGEATDWLDRTVNAHSLSSLSLDQWIAEFDRLKKLNSEILRASAQKESTEAGTASGEATAGQTVDRFCKALFAESSIGMAQVLAWGDAISDYLLKLLDLRKSSLLRSRPDRVWSENPIRLKTGRFLKTHSMRPSPQDRHT